MKSLDNAIDNVLGGGAATPQAQAEAVADPLDGAIDSVIGNDTLKGNLYSSTAISPDTAATQYRLSKDTGVPVDVVRNNQSEIQRRYEFDSIDHNAIQQSTPKLANQLRNPAVAPAIRDDIERLSYFERWTKDFGQSADSGVASKDVGELGLKLWLGNDLTASERNRLNLIQQRQNKDYEIGFVMGIPGAVAEMAPPLYEAVKNSLPAGIAGAGVGAGIALAAGQAGPQVAAPEEVVTVPAAAAVGFTRTFSPTLAIQFGLQEMGASFVDLSSLRDDSGSPIDPEIARGASLLVGVINGALERTGFNSVAKQFPGAEKVLSGLSREAVKGYLKKGIGTEAFKRIGKAALESGTTEGITEFAQQAVQIFFKETAKATSSGDFESFGVKDGDASGVLDFLADALDESAKAGVRGAQGGAGAGGAGAGLSVATEVTAQKLANKQEQSKIAEAIENARESKVFKRDPKLFEEVTQDTLGEKSVYLPADKAQEFFQSKEDFDKFADVVPEMREQMQEAMELGGNLVLPANKVISALARFDFAGLQEFMRLTPESINEKEYQDIYFDQILPHMDKANEESTVKNASEELQQNIESQTMNAGFTPETSRLYSSVFRSVYDTQSARLGNGTEAKAVLDKELGKLKIQAEQVEQQKARRVEELDLTIDRARTDKRPKAGQPIMDMLKEMGGVRSGSVLAGELQSMGITPKTVKGLFKKSKITDSISNMFGLSSGAKNSLGDIDNIPASEFADRFGLNDVPEEEGYVDREFLLDAIRREYGGEDISYVPDARDEAATQLREELERMGVDLGTASNEDVKNVLAQFEGAPKEYNQSGQLKTETPEFKAWFGDSKVVDENGKPIVVYHGSRDIEFDEFKDNGVAKWFASNPKLTELYSSSKGYKFDAPGTIPAYLSIQNPVDLRTLDIKTEVTLKELLSYAKIELSESDMEDVLGDISEGKKYRGWMWIQQRAELVNKLKSLGFDGVIQSEGRGDLESVTWGVFDPTQIKSVNNRGTFDKNDPKILNQSAYHGSPHKFDKFTLDHIGKGEGNQAYGWGLYFAGNKRVAEFYRKTLSLGDHEQKELPFKNKKGQSFKASDKKTQITLTSLAEQYKGDLTKMRAYLEKEAKLYLIPVHDSEGTNKYREAATKNLIKENKATLSDLTKLEKKGYSYTQGQLYEVAIPEDESLLNWDNKIKDQSSPVRDILNNITGDEVINAWRSNGAWEHITGEVLYDQLAGKGRARGNVDGMKKASETLNSLGIKGIKYLDGASRNKGDGFHNYVIFDDSAIEVLNTYYQDDGAEAPRGSIQFNAPDGATIIRLFEGRDLSTLLHESGHFFLETMKKIAESPDVPEQVTEDWLATLEWLGSEDGNLTTEQHEKFARGFEAYLYKGESPSLELKDAFRRFRAWLIRVYKDIKNLNVNVSKEMAGVFDRLLATDEQIEALKTNPLFTPDPKVMEMLTAAEKADYLKRNEKALAEAKDKLMRKTLRQKEREEKKWWKEEREKIKGEVTERVNKSPLYRAVHFLKTGQFLDKETPEGTKAFKMDRSSIRKRFDPELIKYLPSGILGKEGAAPEVIADLFGFTSADEMLKAMANLPDKKAEIEKLTDTEMFNRYGDMLNDGTLEREALDLMHNDDRGGQISYELDTINRRTGNTAPTKEQFKIKAAEVIGKKKLDDAIKPSQYYMAEIKAAREAGKALGKKDYVKAADWKSKQLLNHYLYRESLANKTLTEKSLKRFSKYSKKPAKGKVRIDEDYRQTIVELLQKYNLASKLSDDKRARLSAQSLTEWMERKQRDDAAEFIAAPELVNADTKKHYRDMTMDEFRALADTVENIATQGRQLRTILIEGKREEIKAIGSKIAMSIRDNLPLRKKTLQPRTPGEETKYKLENFFFNTIKARTMIRELDGFKDLGVAHTYIMRQIDNAEVAKTKRLRQVSEEMEALFKKHYNTGVAGFSKNKVAIPEINNSLTKEGIITVALNWGNKDNRAKLLEGHGWSEAQGNAILSHLSESDWKFIQDVWDYINSFWPEIAALEKRRTGVVPEKVSPERFSIQTSDGKTKSITGGYYPLKYDERISADVKDFTVETIADIMRGGFARAQTKRGHTKERVANVNKPVRLDIAPFFQHVNAVVTDLTMGEPIENSYKILHNGMVKSAITDTMGLNVFKQLDMWLKDIAVGGVMAEATFENWMDSLRAGVSISTMGFKMSTILIQTTGYTQTFVKLGPKYALSGLMKFLGGGNPTQINRNAAYVFEKSKIMSERSTTFHRDIYDTLRIMQRKGQIRGKIAQYAFWPIVKMQMMVDIPTWLGAYEKGLSQFDGKEDKAIEFADMTVIQAQSSGYMKDLSGFERGTVSESTRLSPMIRLWTTFYSYFNAKLNLAYEQTKKTEFSKPQDVARLATDYLMLFWVEAVIGEFLLGRAPDFEEDDKDPLWWNIKLALSNIAAQFPVLKEIAGGLQGFDAVPGGLRGLDEIAKAGKSVGNLVEDVATGEEIDIEGTIRALNSAGGIIFKYPSSQINTTLRAIEKANNGEEVTPMDYLIYKK